MKNIYKVSLSVFLLISIFGFVFNTTHITHPYIIDLSNSVLEQPNIPADNALTQEGVQLGRLLFYDSILSYNFKQSCSSCHIQSLSFSDGKKLAIGTFGDTLSTNSMSLVNLAWQKNFFWNGRKHSLESLVEEPLYNNIEMGINDSILEYRLNNHKYYPILFSKAFNTKYIKLELVSKALAQFMRTIVYKPIHLPNEVLNTPTDGLTEHTYTKHFLDSLTPRGLYFRFALMCGSCHVNDVYGNYDYMASNELTSYDKLIKIPSLVNILGTAPYMHDGRFKDLKEVFEHYEEHIDSLLIKNPQVVLAGKFKRVKIPNMIKEYDKQHADLFFKYLADTSIATKKELSNPFNDITFQWKNEIERF